jgi:hypothetical protein
MNIPQPGNHIDQLLRHTRWHHVQLSAMADAKANMMLTVASVVITLSIRYLTEAHFKWAAATMIGFCALTILLSAYAAMPKRPILHMGELPPDPHAPGFNLMFFGDFSKLSYSEYAAAMEDVMNDPSKTYEAQVREIYLLGCFLEKQKFRFVRLAYITFITGMLISTAVFVGGGLLK